METRVLVLSREEANAHVPGFKTPLAEVHSGGGGGGGGVVENLSTVSS